MFCGKTGHPFPEWEPHLKPVNVPDIENKIAILFDRDSKLIQYFLYASDDDSDESIDQTLSLLAEMNHIAKQLKKNGIGGR